MTLVGVLPRAIAAVVTDEEEGLAPEAMRCSSARTVDDVEDEVAPPWLFRIANCLADYLARIRHTNEKLR